MTNSKMTYVDALNTVLPTIENAEVAEKLTALRDTLVKRANKAKATDRKPTAKEQAEAQEREAFRAKVADELNANPNREYTCKELAEAFEVSNPKMANALTALVKADKVERLTSATNKSKVWFKAKA